MTWATVAPARTRTRVPYLGSTPQRARATDCVTRRGLCDRVLACPSADGDGQMVLQPSSVVIPQTRCGQLPAAPPNPRATMLGVLRQTRAAVALGRAAAHLQPARWQAAAEAGPRAASSLAVAAAAQVRVPRSARSSTEQHAARETMYARGCIAPEGSTPSALSRSASEPREASGARGHTGVGGAARHAAAP